MKLSDFYYDLPKELIAQTPLANRTASKLLCLDPRTEEIRHQIFSDIIAEIDARDILVFNNTKVIPARLYGQKETGGQVELLVERILSTHKAKVMLKSSKTPKLHSVLQFSQGVKALVLARQDQFFELEFNQPILAVLEKQGKMPLPPYMQREEQEADKTRYQTVYAEHPGAVAAPTAGLHFDEMLLSALTEKGVKFAYVTLHVGAGTFLPIRTENIVEHQMHHEYMEISAATVAAINQTKTEGGRVIAVGTTTVRCLETAARSGELTPIQTDTNIFIYPGFEFHAVDALITNFHLPESSLLMLISAFAGRELILKTYAEAVKQQYRFFSYGDAMFINGRKK